MDEQRRREHHFYVSTAKFVFYHPQHGIVPVRDPIGLDDAKRYGLVPLIIYGVTIPSVPIRWLTFSPITQQLPLGQVLQTAWSHADGLRGVPDVVRVNRHLAQSDPRLATALAPFGVQLELADSKDKSLGASLRSAQDAARQLWRRHTATGPTIEEAVDALCKDAQADHDFSARLEPRRLSNRKLEDRIDQWLSLPLRQPASIAVESTPWEAGSWLSSWASPLPPDRPRYFYHDGFNRKPWLLTGNAPSDDSDENDSEPIEYEHDNAAEIAKNLVACWPNSAKDIAATAGTTLRQFQWYISGQNPLDHLTHFDLKTILGIEYDERSGQYTAAGPHVLIAKSPKAIEYIYQDVSGGGDACPCEIAPSQGLADPSWRYVLVNTYGSPPSIIMAPRGAAITERLPKLLLNYQGIRIVSLPLYRDIVTTCARACQSPEDNVREMSDFAMRYAREWSDCMWLPGQSL